MQLDLLKDTPTSFLVLIPNEVELHTDPERIARTLRGLEEDTRKQNISVFIEEPRLVLMDDDDLKVEEEAERRQKLDALEAGVFILLEMAGNTPTPYVREILVRAGRSETKVKLYAESESTLVRYARMAGVRD